MAEKLFAIGLVLVSLTLGTYPLWSTEPEFTYVVAYETCGGLKDTIEVNGWGNGLTIDGYKKAVPELMVKGGQFEYGFPVAYNVCNFKILSKTPVK